MQSRVLHCEATTRPNPISVVCSSRCRIQSLQTEIDGLTGHVKFDHTGKRADFSLDLVELTAEGLKKVNFKKMLKTKKTNICEL